MLAKIRYSTSMAANLLVFPKLKRPRNYLAFEQQCYDLLTMIKASESFVKTDEELAFTLNRTPRQISRYINYLKKQELIKVTVTRHQINGSSWWNKRTIEVVETKGEKE